MSDFDHLNAIDLRLSHERSRAATATAKEMEWRAHNVRMIEREREAEVAFLAKRGVFIPNLDDVLSDDELLRLITE